MSKTLIVFCHSTPEKSVQNMKLLEKAKQDPNITILNVCEKYQAQHFIMTEEQIKHDAELLKTHDKIIFQFPLYWAQIPPCGRMWQDQVLNVHAYTADKLKGKTLGCVITTYGPYSGFTNNDMFGPAENVNWPYKCMSKFLFMGYQAPFFFCPEMNEEEVKKNYMEYVK